MFITFEGGDGSGKSTQLKKLASYLEQQDISLVLTREPGGCSQAEEIRTMLLEGDKDKWNGTSEALLFSAARYEHVRQTIRPALQQGKWVLSDRFADSTTVYQSLRGVDESHLHALHRMAVENTWPDLTFVFDIEVKAGLGRKHTQAGDGLKEMRMESLGLEFHEKVRIKFREIAAQNPERCILLDASGTIEQTHELIVEHIRKYVEKQAA